MNSNYAQFLNKKRWEAPQCGLESIPELNPALFPFQRDIVAWALRKGRAAIFADTGMGKTLMQLEWARRTAEHTGKPTLIFAPLAVGHQTEREAAKFGIDARYSKGPIESPVVITNYERLSHFNPADFGAVVLDESSILKSFMGKTKQLLMSSFAGMKFKLACTATPAPNDHLELGNHSEFLDVLPSSEMIARWFINDTSSFGTYRLKWHAVGPFWDWVSSWSRMVGLPSDLGYSDDGFILPKLDIHKHLVNADIVSDRGDNLFRIPELSATSYHKEKRLTVDSRAETIANLIAAEPDEPWLVWCDTDYEADSLRTACPTLTEVRGSDSPEKKESNLIGFAAGEVKHLLTKPKIAGFGMNFQHCARMAFVGPTYSYEAFYQAIRRCWRFGQLRHVQVHIAMATTERAVWDVLMRKANDHETMKANMFSAMRRAQRREYDRIGSYNPNVTGRLPSWL